jgi:hypothetical protein
MDRSEIIPEKIMSEIGILKHPVHDESARIYEDVFVDGDLELRGESEQARRLAR